MLYNCILRNNVSVHQKLALCRICCLFKPDTAADRTQQCNWVLQSTVDVSWLERYQVLWISMPAVVGDVDGSIVVGVNSADRVITQVCNARPPALQ